jgi:hypothetical protein
MSTLILNPGSQHRQDSGILQAAQCIIALKAVPCAVARPQPLDYAIDNWVAAIDSALSSKSGPQCLAGRRLPPHMCCMQTRGYAIGLGVEWLCCFSRAEDSAEHLAQDWTSPETYSWN